MKRVIRYDGRNLWFGFGRSLIAFATLSELLFTPVAALFHPVAFVYGPICRPDMELLSMYCLGGDGRLGVKNAIIIAILFLALIGWFPRWTAIPHLYATSSVTTAMTLPDGGDNIALIVLILLTPIALIDGRRWVWVGPLVRMRIEYRGIGFVSAWAIRLQMFYVYADSAIAKMGVGDWANGSAFYYFVRDKMFGSAGLARSFWYFVSDNTLGVLAVTWGSIILELVIALLTVLSARYRIIALVLAVFLHAAIWMAMGLFSFSLVMIGVSVIVANSDRVSLRKITASHSGRKKDISYAVELEMVGEK